MITNKEGMLLIKFLTEHNLLDAMIVAAVGGIVNYFIHEELADNIKNKLAWFSKHLFISIFTGFVVGLLCVDFNITATQTLLFAAIAGTSGSEIIVVLQQKVSGWLANRQV